MALRLIEGFESFGANGTTGTTLEDALKDKYGDASTTVSDDCVLNDGWGSGLAIQAGDDITTNYIKASFDAQTTWLMGAALKVGPVLDTGSLFALNSSAHASIIRLGLGAAGQLYVYNQSNGTFYYGTRVLKPGNWYYIEFKAYIHASAGTLDVHINGVSDIAESGLDTIYSTSTNASSVSLIFGTTTESFVDDFYIADGTAGVNTFIGPCKVETIRPDADDAVAWDRSAGANNYELVNEPTPTEATYVEGDTLAESDLYTYSDLSVIASDVAGVQLNTGGFLTAAGARQLDDRVVSAAANSNGPGVALASETGEIIWRVIEQDPNTAANWAIAAVDAVKGGVIVGD